MRPWIWRCILSNSYERYEPIKSFGMRGAYDGFLRSVYTYSTIKAPFHKIVPKTAVNTAAPAHHWPLDNPSLNTPSDLNAATPKKNNNYSYMSKSICYGCCYTLQWSDRWHWQSIPKISFDWRTHFFDRACTSGDTYPTCAKIQSDQTHRSR